MSAWQERDPVGYQHAVDAGRFGEMPSAHAVELAMDAVEKEAEYLDGLRPEQRAALLRAMSEREGE